MMPTPKAGFRGVFVQREFAGECGIKYCRKIDRTRIETPPAMKYPVGEASFSLDSDHHAFWTD